jgi:hypothetical protein
MQPLTDRPLVSAAEVLADRAERLLEREGGVDAGGLDVVELGQVERRPWVRADVRATRANEEDGVVTVQPVAVRNDLAIHPRDAWGADIPPIGPIDVEPDVRFLLVHHSATRNDYRPDEVVRVLRGMYWTHTHPDRRWPDVCYHLLVDRFGGVWEGRAGSLAGAVVADATGGSQGHAMLVCLVGDYSDDLPPEPALASMRRSLAWLADRHHVDTTPGAMVTLVSRGSNLWPAGTAVTAPTIAGHRDMSDTACPGDALYRYVRNGLAADVTALRTR